MKYNLTTDLSVATFKSYGNNLTDKIDSDYEIDYKKCLFFETAQVLDADKNPPHDISAMKYIYSRKYRPYEMFKYPYKYLDFHGRLGVGRIDTTTIYTNDANINTIHTKVINTDNIFADYGEISSLNVTSITATNKVSSELGIIDNISGDKISSYINGRFETLTATGTADMVAMNALWADVAELYYGDNKYEPGTLVQFGGTNELTLANDCANGCISEKPAVLMNTAIRKYINSVPLLLTGKTNVKVVGSIEKFDRIELSDIKGVAQKHTDKQILGIALESNKDEEIKLVECIIKLTI